MITIEKLLPVHWPGVSQIYIEGIQTGNATFEMTAPEWQQWDSGHLQHSRIIAAVENAVAGWAALSPVSERCVYAGVAEVSIYIGEKFRGQHIGDLLLKALIPSSEDNNIWTLQSGIFPENNVSVHLHEKNGFRIIGRREKIGKMNGIWRDTLMLERRSNKAGL